MALTKVSTDGVKDDAITSGKIPANAVGTSELADNAVTAGKTSGVQTTINNNADNRVITGSGTANTLNGEANLTFTGTQLGVTDGNGTTTVGGNYALLKRTSGTTNYIAAPNADAVLDISADETIRFGTVNTADFVSTERMRLNSDGDLLIGRTSTIDTSEVLGIKGPSGDHCTFGITTDGTTNLGIIAFNDNDANFRGQIRYSHNADVMQFHAGGSERINISADGIKFNGDTAAANALDDYEEGTWTPDWRGASALGTTSYGVHNAASYVKIGNQVTVRGHTNITGSSGGSGFWFINNLPFTVGGGDNRAYRSVGSVFLESFDFNDDVTDIVCFAERNNNDMQLRSTRDNAGGGTNISVNSDTSFDIMWTITYPTA